MSRSGSTATIPTNSSNAPFNYAAAARSRHTYTSSVSGKSPNGATPGTTPPSRDGEAKQPAATTGQDRPTPPGTGTQSRKASVSTRAAPDIGVGGVAGSKGHPARGSSGSINFGSVDSQSGNTVIAATGTTSGSSAAVPSSTDATKSSTQGKAKAPFDLHSFFQSGGTPQGPSAPSPVTTHQQRPPTYEPAPSPRPAHQPHLPHHHAPPPPNAGQQSYGPPPMGQPFYPSHPGGPPGGPPGVHHPHSHPPPQGHHHPLSASSRPFSPAQPPPQAPQQQAPPPPQTTGPYGGPPYQQNMSPHVQHLSPHPPAHPSPYQQPAAPPPASPYMAHAKPPGPTPSRQGPPNTSPSPVPAARRPPAGGMNGVTHTSPRMGTPQPPPPNGQPHPPPPQHPHPQHPQHPGPPPQGQYWYNPYGNYQYYQAPYSQSTAPPPVPPGTVPMPPPSGPAPTPPVARPPSGPSPAPTSVQSPGQAWSQPPSATTPVPPSPGMRNGFNVSAREFQPSAPPFQPRQSQRQSHAIKIRDPKSVPATLPTRSSTSSSHTDNKTPDDVHKPLRDEAPQKSVDLASNETGIAEARLESVDRDQETGILGNADNMVEETTKVDAQDTAVFTPVASEDTKPAKGENTAVSGKQGENTKLEAREPITAIEEVPTATSELEKDSGQREQSDSTELAKKEGRDGKAQGEVDLPVGGKVDNKEATGAGIAVRKEEVAPKPLGDDLGEKKKRPVPGPLDLSNTSRMSRGTIDDAHSALPSALESARVIENLNDVSYPEHISSPRAELNPDPEPGKFRYDRHFLLQFMDVCREKPEQLPNLEAIGMVDSDPSATPPPRSTSFSGNRRTSAMGPPPPMGRQPSGPIHPISGPGGIGRVPSGPSMGMGNFQHQPTAKTSEERFAASSSMRGGPGVPVGGQFSPAMMGRAIPMARTASSGQVAGGIPQSPAPGGRQRSGRGTQRRGTDKQTPILPPAPLAEQVAPLTMSENRWVPTAMTSKGQGDQSPDSPEMVQRRVRALLNKLTIERFESISNQIIEWANKSEKERDGRILRQVIQLVFEKATDEANWSEMYARLCRKMMEVISSSITDESVKDVNGHSVSGGNLFRKYLLNRCQEDYERGWAQKESLAAAAASKASEDKAKQEANTANAESGDPKEAEILSDEYYAAQKAKRQGLGLVRFIGELFKLSMLTERIMHECIKKLLSNIDDPEEEDIESLCRLMTTVGKILDTSKAHEHLNIYFLRMKVLADKNKLASRIRFMLQDVIDLRNGGWVPRATAAGPKSISQIHQDAQKEKEEATRQANNSTKGPPRMGDQSRTGSRRGQPRDQYTGVPQAGADGWQSVGNTPARPQVAGDLSGFGKVRESSSAISLGPSTVFSKGVKSQRGGKPAETPSRSTSISAANRFEALSNASATETPVRRPSGLVPAATPEANPAPTRPKLNLLPRTKETKPPEPSDAEDSDAPPPDSVLQSIKNTVAEFFSVKDVTEGVECFKALQPNHRRHLVKALIDKAVDSKQDAVTLLVHLFKELVKPPPIVNPVAFREGFAPVVAAADELYFDIPALYSFLGELLVAADMTNKDVSDLQSKMQIDGGTDEELALARQMLQKGFQTAQ